MTMLISASKSSEQRLRDGWLSMNHGHTPGWDMELEEMPQEDVHLQ